MTKMTITRDMAAKVLAVVDAGLSSGIGEPVPGKMCVEAAVCFALGQKHGDEPECVSPALRVYKIKSNDSAWSSPQARAKGMRRLALAQLGTKGTLDEKAFAVAISEMTIRVVVPIALRAAASMHPAQEWKAKLEAAANVCETNLTTIAARVAAYEVAADAAADAVTQDKVLSMVAEAAVQVLVKLNAAGTQWLDLAPLDDAA